MGRRPSPPPGVTTPGTRTWSNLGPLAARSQFNGTYYKAMDSGRPTAIVMDPSNPNGVFVATSGGGVWYAPDINGSYPSWSPITESLGSLAIGAMDVARGGGRGGDPLARARGRLRPEGGPGGEGKLQHRPPGRSPGGRPSPLSHRVAPG